MTGQTVQLFGAASRAMAKRLIDAAPWGAVLNIREATRTNEQNAKMHVMLGIISRHRPMGWNKPTDAWKAIFMRAMGQEIQMEQGLDGEYFPLGYRSSKMTKQQMSDMIEFMNAFAAEHNIDLSDKEGTKT